jgi:hypothetical protein
MVSAPTTTDAGRESTLTKRNNGQPRPEYMSHFNKDSAKETKEQQAARLASYEDVVDECASFSPLSLGRFALIVFPYALFLPKTTLFCTLE